MDSLLQFPWPQAAAMLACVSYLVHVTTKYATARKALEGMMTREEYERDQARRGRELLADVRQMILDLRR